MIALDRLPWPLGEDILASLFAAAELVRGSHRRLALAWASQQPGGGGVRLARAICAFRGRWVARAALLGVRSPEALTRRAVIRGEEHLTAAPEGTILLGFHLGPPNVDVTLRILGQKLAWVGTSRNSWVWTSEAWRPLSDPRQNLAPPADERFWPGYLYRARRMLLDGGALFILADSRVGRATFRDAAPRWPDDRPVGLADPVSPHGRASHPRDDPSRRPDSGHHHSPGAADPASGRRRSARDVARDHHRPGQRLCPAISRAVPVSGVFTDRLPAKTGAGWVGSRRARTAADGRIRQNVIGVWRRPKGRAIL